MRLNSKTPALLNAALLYAAQGWPVFPLRGKVPRIPNGNGVKDATTDEATIRGWWAKWPNANVGVAMAGLVAIDVDERQGGFETLAELEREHGPLPATRTVETGGGGRHYIYASNGRPIKSGANKLGQGVDLKSGEGSYLVAPPSIHPDTKRAYETSNDAAPVAVPGWVADITEDEGGGTAGPLQARTPLVDLLDHPADRGRRNEWLTQVAGHYAKQFRYRDAYDHHVRSANAKLAAPLADPEVRKIADSIWRSEQERKARPNEEGCTDMGNARRLVVAHGQDLRHCKAHGGWLVWDGRRWSHDLTDEIWRRAKDTVLRIYTEAATADDETERSALAKWAVKSESAARLRDMVALARSEPEVAIAPDDLDADPWLLNVRNGTLDLRTGELRPHNPDNLITHIADVEYDPEAPFPEWTAFLKRVTQGDVELEAYLQRAVGYSLTGKVSEQVLFFLYGSGANGKSTFLNVLLSLLGDYGKQADPELLLAHQGDVHPTGMADLQGSRLVVCSEVEEGRRWAEVTVKQLTGGDRIKARFMRQDFFEFSPTFKIWLAANHKPTVRGSDHAIWRRLKLVGFEARIPPAEQIADFDERLIAEEAAGILRWAVEGCVLWQQQRGLSEPTAVEEAVAEYRAEEDVLGAFLEECCDIEPQSALLTDDTRWFATNSQLMSAYQEWAKRNGERLLNQRELSRALQERGFEAHRRKVGRGRTGLRLKGRW